MGNFSVKLFQKSSAAKYSCMRERVDDNSTKGRVESVKNKTPVSFETFASTIIICHLLSKINAIVEQFSPFQHMFYK